MSASFVFEKLASLRLLDPSLGITDGDSLLASISQPRGLALLSAVASAVDSSSPVLAQHQDQEALLQAVEQLAGSFGDEFSGSVRNDPLNTLHFFTSYLQLLALERRTRDNPLFSALAELGEPPLPEAAALVASVSPIIVDQLRQGGPRLISIEKDQVSALAQLAAQLQVDYRQRAAMMLKRLDVTMRALFWGKATPEVKLEMKAIIENQRVLLEQQALPDVGLVDVMLANSLLLRIRPITDASETTVPSVARKFVIQGTVPDRGGRGDRKGGKMPAFKPRQAEASSKKEGASPTPKKSKQSESSQDRKPTKKKRKGGRRR